MCKMLLMSHVVWTGFASALGISIRSSSRGSNQHRFRKDNITLTAYLNGVMAGLLVGAVYAT